MHFLAQATQPSGMSAWSVGDWAAFLALVAGFISATLVPAIIAILKAGKASADAAAAQASSDANSASITRVSDGLHSTQAQVTTIAAAMAPTQVPPR